MIAFPCGEYVCGKLFTAAFAQGKQKKVGYYRCMNDDKNLNADRWHEQMDNILKELSLPTFYVEYLRQAVSKSLQDNLANNKKLIAEKRNQLKQLDTKLDNVQEDRNNRVMDIDAYNNGFPNTTRTKPCCKAKSKQ